MASRILLALAAAAALAAAGCENREPIGAGFGDSVRHNMSMQIINPQPRAAAAPEMSGTRAAGAVKRYEKGDVKELQIEQTSRTRRAN